MALGVPQYRLRAIEGGLLTQVPAELARRYFRFLGIDTWGADWCCANRELATRVGCWTAHGHGRAAAADSMSAKRIAKPTGWVVDMRHYLDEPEICRRPPPNEY